MREHITIVHFEGLDAAPYEELEIALRQEGLQIRRHSTPTLGPYAALEWLVPTAVVVYIAKPYFDSFLAEAGKDHYDLLKRGVDALTRRLTGQGALHVRHIASKGKSADDRKFSLAYSVVAELQDGVSMKLLLQTSFTPEQASQAVALYLEVLRKFHSDELEPNDISGLRDGRLVGKTLLVAYVPEKNCLEVVDPVPKGPRDRRGNA